MDIVLRTQRCDKYSKSSTFNACFGSTGQIPAFPRQPLAGRTGFSRPRHRLQHRSGSKTARRLSVAKATDHLGPTVVAGRMAPNIISIPAALASGGILRCASGGAARHVRWGARTGREWAKPTVLEPSSGCAPGIRACRLYVAPASRLASSGTTDFTTITRLGYWRFA